jgi:hypothetical protein
MKTAILATLATLMMVLGTNAYAHSGGTDNNGCHTNPQDRRVSMPLTCATLGLDDHLRRSQ